MNIRINDEKLARDLAEMAKAHRRTLEAEVIDILKSAVQEGAEDRLSIARKIAAMTPKDRVQKDSTILVREDRDR